MKRHAERGYEYVPIDCYKESAKLEKNGIQNDITNMDCTARELLSFSMSRDFIRAKGGGKFKRFNQRCRASRDYICRLAGKSPEQMTYREFRTEMRDYLFIPYIPRIWAEYRQIYRPDPDFTDELLKTESFRMPADILRRCPYPCFYVDFSQTKRFRPFLGSFVFLSFREDGLTDIAFLRIAEVENGIDNSPYMFYSTYFTADDLIRYGMLVKNQSGGMDFSLRKEQIGDSQPARSNLVTRQLTGKGEVPDAYSGDMLLLLFNCLLYLCSDEPDIKTRKRERLRRSAEDTAEHARDASKEGRKEGGNDDVMLNDIGVRYGSAVRRNREQEKEGSERVVSVGHIRKSPAAHTRRAHWHTYHVGAGRKETRVRWLAPIFVNGSESMSAVLHEIKKET